MRITWKQVDGKPRPLWPDADTLRTMRKARNGRHFWSAPAGTFGEAFYKARAAHGSALFGIVAQRAL